MTAPVGSDGIPLIQPQATPISYEFKPAKTNDGRDCVVLQFFTLTGTTVIFLIASDAKNMAANLERVATVAQTGLILPPGVG